MLTAQVLVFSSSSLTSTVLRSRLSTGVFVTNMLTAQVLVFNSSSLSSCRQVFLYLTTTQTIGALGYCKYKWRDEKRYTCTLGFRCDLVTLYLAGVPLRSSYLVLTLGTLHWWYTALAMDRIQCSRHKSDIIIMLVYPSTKILLYSRPVNYQSSSGVCRQRTSLYTCPSPLHLSSIIKDSIIARPGTKTYVILWRPQANTHPWSTRFIVMVAFTKALASLSWICWITFVAVISVTNLSVNVSFPTWAVSPCICDFEHFVPKQLINLPILPFSTDIKELVVMISKKEYEEQGNTNPLKTISSEAIAFANFSVNACFTVSATSAMRVKFSHFSCLLAWSWSTFQCYHPMPPFTTDTRGTLGRYFHLVRT